MGQILGLGITHYPGLAFKGNLRQPHQPAARRSRCCPRALRSPENWHPTMREQWGDDEGARHSARHRSEMINQFRKARAELDAFHPDFVVFWGDDQYENFHEDCVPPSPCWPTIGRGPALEGHQRGANSWDEPEDKTFTIAGTPGRRQVLGVGAAARRVRRRLRLQAAAPAAGARVRQLGAVPRLDRKGFPYPVVPITVNAYGRPGRGPRRAAHPVEAAKSRARRMDPPGPQPWRCFQLGAAVTRALAPQPLEGGPDRVVELVHSFLVAKHALMYPDVESDQRYYEALRAATGRRGANTSISRPKIAAIRSC